MKNKLIIVLTYCIILISAKTSFAIDTAWVQQSSGISQYTTSVHFINQSTGWATADQGKMIKTTNGGTNWFQLTTGVFQALYSVKFFDEMTGWASGGGGTLIKTTNGGASWTEINTGVSNSLKLFFINSQTGWISGSGSPTVVMATTNGGTNWTQYYTGINEYFTDMFFTNQNSGYITTTDGNLLRTTNAGVNWTSQNITGSGLFSVYFNDSLTGWVVGVYGRVGRTTNGGLSWSVNSLPISGIFLSVKFINNSTGWLCGGGGRLYVTTNGGANWTSQLNPSSTQDLNSIFFYGTNGWACGTNGTMIHTTSGGFPLPSAPVNLNALAVSSNQVNLSWQDSSNNEQYFKIERSTNGNNWVLIDSVNANVTNYQSTGLSGGTTYFFRVYASSWFGSSQPTSSVSILTFPVAPALFSPVNNSSGVSLTPQLVWLSVPSATVYRLQVSTDSLFTSSIINDSNIVQTQYNISSGILNNNIRYYWRVMAKNSSGWSAVSQVWNFRTGLVGVEQPENEIPLTYKVYDNYPNPFNPSTKIKFDLPKQTAVKIIVYDLTGRLVKEIVNGNYPAGKFEIEFNAANLSSGVYLYKIQSNEFTEIKKMILVK
ncbi:MAG: T9SS type A sorting domain-containing protein [Ignavibacteria bacterium]|nr:T9SS type A sorting domain-containing protein [Ignavibacteria bacterium]